MNISKIGDAQIASGRPTAPLLARSAIRLLDRRSQSLVEESIVREERPLKSRSPGRESTGKDGFPHYMLKEIYEQPFVVGRLIEESLDQTGRIFLPSLALSAKEIQAFSRITIAASGSSRHAGMVGEFMLERMTGLPVEVDFASQYCYRDPVVASQELTVFLSQS